MLRPWTNVPLDPFVTPLHGVVINRMDLAHYVTNIVYNQTSHFKTKTVLLVAFFLLFCFSGNKIFEIFISFIIMYPYRDVACLLWSCIFLYDSLDEKSLVYMEISVKASTAKIVC